MQALFQKNLKILSMRKDLPLDLLAGAQVEMPGLGRDAAAGKKLLERDELVALRAQCVDGLQGRVYAGGVEVVQQDDVAVLRIVHDLVGDKVPIAHAPIHRVDGPVDHGHGDGGFKRVA